MSFSCLPYIRYHIGSAHTSHYTTTTDEKTHNQWERDTHTQNKKSKRQNGCKPTTTTTTTTDCYTFACIIENNVQSHFHNQILPTNGDDDFSSVSRHVEPDHVFFGWLSIKTLARNDFSGDCKQTNEGKRERERLSKRRMEKSHWLGEKFSANHSIEIIMRV